jgi:hydrogenase maturation factor
MRKIGGKYVENNLIKIKSVANNIEADLIINLLQNNNIQCLKKSKEAGDYMNIYMGYSVFGEDIYVNEKDYQSAMELLNSLSNNDEILTDEDNNTDFQVPYYRNPRLAARIIIFAILGATIITTIVNIMY